MKTLTLRLGIVLLGLLLLVGAAWALLTSRPLDAVPPLPATGQGARPRFGEPAASVLAGVRPPAREGVAPVETAAAMTPPLTRTTNILLAGVDTRSGPEGGRTDSLTVLVLDDRSPHLGLVSIPRDLEVQLVGHEPERINAVYGIGAREGGGGAAGDALLREVIRAVIGLPIAHAVYVDHAGFEALVDELGGVSVGVRCPIRDRFLDARAPEGRLELRLEAGVQVLDGRTALMYARSRHGRGVFDRAARQQAVLLALRDRFLELGPTRTLETLPSLRRAVYTDLRSVDLLRLARRLMTSGREHLHGLVLGPRQAEVVIRENGRWVMLPRPEEIRLALGELFKAPLPGQRQAACPDMDAALKR